MTQHLDSLSMPASDKRWPAEIWLAVLSLSFATFSIVTAEFLPTGLLTPMAEGLGISEGLAGQAVTATASVGAVAALLANIVIGRLDRKIVLIGLSLLVIVSNLVAAFATSFVVLLIARAILGVALSGFWSLTAAVVARLVGVGLIGRGMSIIFVGVSLATIFGPSVGAAISDVFGWRIALIAASGAALIATILQIVALPRLPAATANHPMTIIRLAGRRGVQLGLLAVLLVAGGHFAGFVYVRAFLEQITLMEPATVALTLLAFGIASFFGNLAGGVMADRNQGRALAITGFLLGGSALGLTVFGTGTVPTVVLVVVWGFAFGGAPIVLQTGIAQAAPDELEAAGSLMVTAFQTAIASGAILGGLLVDNLGVVYAVEFTAVMALAAIGLTVTPQPKPVPAE